MAFSVEESRLLGQKMDPVLVDFHLLQDCRAVVIKEGRKDDARISNLPDWCREALGV